MVTITYFVHGTTTDNAAKLCSGWKQAELNDLGKEQAKDLGRVSKERGDKFDTLFTSDLKRAIDSSNIAFTPSNNSICLPMGSHLYDSKKPPKIPLPKMTIFICRNCFCPDSFVANSTNK